jgi:hypothetical protein
LIPIITNVAVTKLIKLDTDLINSVKQPTLARDLISYLRALNEKGLQSVENLLSRQHCIENKIKDHKLINTQTFSSLGLETVLNGYNAELVVLEEAKDITNNAILEPILPILNKYKNVDIEECLTYKNRLDRTAAFKISLLFAAGFIGPMYSVIALSSLTPWSMFLSMLTLPFFAVVMNNDLGQKTEIVSNYLKIYKDHLAAIKSNTSTKLKNKKNIE